MKEQKLTLSEIYLKDRKVKLSKPLILNLTIFERGEFGDTYVLEHQELGLLAIQENLDRTKGQIQEQISELWDEYLDCSIDDLTVGGKRFREKLLKYLSEDRSGKS